MTDMEKLSKIIETGQTRKAAPVVDSLLDSGLSPEEILRDGIMPGLAEVGRKFEAREYYIPEMLVAARASKLATEAMRVRVGYQPQISSKKMVIGTVQTDLHDIGKNLVAMAMRNVGIDVVDLGVDVAPYEFVHAVERDENVIFAGISALLTTTLPALKTTVEALRQCKAADRLTIFVGGAPVTAKYAQSIGADIYTETAFAAAKAAREILLKRGDIE